MNYEEEIFEIIKKYHVETNGSCGMSVVHLKNIIGVEYCELKDSLNKLFKDRRIRIREGINHKLIYLNDRTTNTNSRPQS